MFVKLCFLQLSFWELFFEKRSNLHVCHLQDDTNWSLISSWLNQLEEIEDHVDAVRKKVKETATANKGLSTGERATYFQFLKVRLKRRWKDTKKIPPLPQTFSGGSPGRVQAAPWGAEKWVFASRDEEKRMRPTQEGLNGVVALTVDG